MTPAGKFRKRLAIEALPGSQAVDPEFNEPTYADWKPQATRWASIKPLSGKELVFAQQVVADATHEITVRCYAGLTTRMRFNYTDDRTGATRIFNIESIKDVEERHVEQQCFCHEQA